jgi:exodeoxyribonuclease V beta subunit
MNPFELSQAPLTGTHLIEAGAGTGKTYTIAGLFLRLLLERGLPVEQILVVTYTNAATEELKSRIRRRLLAAKTFLTRGGADTLMRDIVQHGIEPQAALRRIQDALIDFDRAAIFTIHGFCQRVLHHFAFETGHLFQAELVQDIQPLIQETADDFWRRTINRAPYELIRFIVDRAKGPETLAALSHTCRFPRVRVVPPPRKPPLDAIARWRRLTAQITGMWPQARSTVSALLMSEGLNALKYGKCEPDPAQTDPTRRQLAVGALTAAMDQWDGTYPLFERFDRLCQSCLIKATKKKHSPPAHPFFELCDRVMEAMADMEGQMAEYWRYLKVRWLGELRMRLDRKKSRENVLFFDDLLLQVHAALQNKGKEALIKALQTQYQAVLVDEFQDTDALQYEIFTELFADRRSLLFMIGDPKQAIYSFRGADLFSYLYAKQKAPHRYTLTRNWRATPALIQALNTIFGTRSRPFGYAQIPYQQALAARTPSPCDEDRPFHLWYVTRTDEQGPLRPLSQQEAVSQIVAAVADRIVSILSDDQAPVAPEEIAVLTRTHHQAQLIKAALAKLRVPAVLHSAGSVFDSREAAEMAQVLQAVAMPADPRRVRAAMASDLIGVSARKLCISAESPGNDWQRRWMQFEEYHQMWLRYGFYRMFNRLMAHERVRSRLLHLPDGERRLTNLLHLAELLHEASVTLQLGPEGVLKWLATQRRTSAAAAADEQKLRLESDAHAVRIITIHKSKGLQFDIVFCPFVWTPAKVDDHLVSFHDPEREEQLTLSIGPGIDPAHQRLALEEALAENLRLMYVALTRARRSCYMAWGAIKGTELSAPAYLLHGPPESSRSEDWVGPLKTKMAALSDADLIAELHPLEQHSAGTIRIEPLPPPGRRMYANSLRGDWKLNRRKFDRHIDLNWRIVSFSSMTAELSEIERPGRDESDQGPEPVATTGGPDDLFGFPKGVRCGLFFHDLLEHWDIGVDENQTRRFIAQKLGAHAFSPAYTATIELFLDRLARTRLPAAGIPRAFSLNEVAFDSRINEMEFYFPIKHVSADQLKKLFKNRTGDSCSDLIATHVERLSFSPVQGFLKGYVDCVFEHAGRYYLVDWKSNHLGNLWTDYEASRLDAVMIESFYFLQAHLYALALDLLLRQRVENYDYTRHFGGVYYIFLRGIRGDRSSTGIHYMMPPPELLGDLKEALLPV